MSLSDSLVINTNCTLKNRIAKSALSEQLSDRNHNPTDELIKLYSRWAEGGAGLLITGNVMLNHDSIAEPKNIVLNEYSDLARFKLWAKSAKQNGTRCFMQLNHPGRQIPNFLSVSPKAPSEVAMKGTMRLGFNKPKALSTTEIRGIISRFAYSAELAKECGFDGVQIHGAHGYLVNQFLSPLHNQRTDEWGGSSENRMRFVIEVCRAIRAKVGDKFPIAIKLNSTDAQAGGYTEDDAIKVAKRLIEEGIDLIEVSGGNYESQAMMGDEKTLADGRGYFSHFAEQLKTLGDVPIMVTGGLRNKQFINESIKNGKFELAGLGRPFALDPNLPQKLLSNSNESIPPTPYIKSGVGFLDRLLIINITWYEQQLAQLGKGYPSRPQLSPWISMLNTITAMGLKALLPRRTN